METGLEASRAGTEEMKRFDEHYEQVRTLLREDAEARGRKVEAKLLDYQVGEGWERLCEFLGKDVPQQEFPRVNDSTVFKGRMRTLVRGKVKQLLQRAALLSVPVIAVGGALFLGWRSFD